VHEPEFIERMAGRLCCCPAEDHLGLSSTRCEQDGADPWQAEWLIRRAVPATESGKKMGSGASKQEDNGHAQQICMYAITAWSAF
jgi:hypothetical protein